MEIESKQPHSKRFALQRGRQILERRKEIEQELVDMLKETESDFTLDHVRDAIYNEEDNDDNGGENGENGRGKRGHDPLITCFPARYFYLTG